MTYSSSPAHVPQIHAKRRVDMRVRLTRRLASCIDGVNLAGHKVGDILDITLHDAQLLIAEEWAVPVAATESRRPLVLPMTTSDLLHEGADQPAGGHEQRRAEDRFREELRDSRATTISKGTVQTALLSRPPPDVDKSSRKVRQHDRI
jgi:hypothetical protein